mmetsp:Transcript_22939/g.32827  ORF Transcript_22939/g.32827 Transcript_22939/m.32827 type:complete len:102 (+) Transcript_22939:1550-1855(+)
MSIQDRYYTRAEYHKLSNAKRLGLNCKQEARGSHPKPKVEKSKKASPLNLSKHSIKVIASAIKANALDSDNDTSDERSVEETPSPKKTKSNRTNSALKRKK